MTKKFTLFLISIIVFAVLIISGCAPKADQDQALIDQTLATFINAHLSGDEAKLTSVLDPELTVKYNWWYSNEEEVVTREEFLNEFEPVATYKLSGKKTTIVEDTAVVTGQEFGQYKSSSIYTLDLYSDATIDLVKKNGQWYISQIDYTDVQAFHQSWTDDFTTEEWFVETTDQHSFQYVNGKYEMKTTALDNYSLWVRRIYQYPDFRAQVEMEVVEGAAYYGIIFNHDRWNTEDYYIFKVRPASQKFSLQRYKNGAYDHKVIDWTVSEAINGAFNTLAISQKDGFAELFVNGVSVAKVEVETVTGLPAMLGFYAATDNSSFTVNVDNLEYTQLP